MNRNGISIVIAAAVLFLATGAIAAVSFIYPAPNSWVERSNHMVVKFNSPEITAVRIDVNGIAGDLLQVGSPEYRRAFQDILIVQPVWDRGRNDVTLEAFIGKDKVETAHTAFYYTPPGESATAPPEFSRRPLHAGENEKLCVDCHTLSPSPAQLTRAPEKENPCVGCHRRMLAVKYVHGPVGTFSCMYCHSERGTPKYSVIKREAALCNDCHADKAADFAKRKYVHGPVAGGMCESCHDPHGSQSYGQLKAPINELCLSCHETIKKSPHVVRTTTGLGHPVSGRKDPSVPKAGREMSCISCHNPHAGDVRYFFVNNAEERMQLCQMCHNK